MLPSTLALVDDDVEYGRFLAENLRERGIAVDSFVDGAGLLTHRNVFDYAFYVVDLMLPGIDGLELIRVIRRRTNAGLLVVSGKLAPDVFDQVITAGADMYLAKPVQFNQVALAIEAVQRRAQPTAAGGGRWVLYPRSRQLVTPGGEHVDLSLTDQRVLECLLAANGAVVTREALKASLRGDAASEATDGINSTIYRLRRKIERATAEVVPLQSVSRVGYAFRAPLVADSGPPPLGPLLTLKDG